MVWVGLSTGSALSLRIVVTGCLSLTLENEWSSGVEQSITRCECALKRSMALRDEFESLMAPRGLLEVWGLFAPSAFGTYTLSKRKPHPVQHEINRRGAASDSNCALKSLTPESP